MLDSLGNEQIVDTLTLGEIASGFLGIGATFESGDAGLFVASFSSPPTDQVPEVPLPAGAWLFLSGLALTVGRRRKIEP